ncbi:MAG TPA: hypothetical protein VF544_15090 [Pyrinomonadaceae bacterium]
MSATSPEISIETQGASVRETLYRLHFRRRLWRACAVAALALSCMLLLLLLAGLVDYAWPIARAARVALLSAVLFSALLSLACSVRLLLKRHTLTEVAREIERAAGQEQNALVTFAEGESDARAFSQAPYITARLYRQAHTELSQIDERVVAPAGWAQRGALLLALVLLALFALRLLAPNAFARETARVLRLYSEEARARVSEPGDALSMTEADGTAVAVEEWRVRVVPPAYSSLSAEEVAGDAPVRVLAGSQVEVALRARGPIDGATLGFGGVVGPMRALGGGRFAGAFTANASGAFEARVLADEGLAPAPFVRAVEVYRDNVPEVRITEPEGDQLLRAVPAGPITVRWTARDDLGLGGVSLRYIKSRGEGDAAKFTSGELSRGSIEQASAREWRGTGALDLARLDVRAGDTLVFWVEARDRNPVADNAGRSASLAIAIAGPEGLKLNLSDLRPNEIGRFLLSQRQIIIHTEKLHGERARLSSEEVRRRAAAIAAEQREFKNSFNDYVRTEGAGEEHGGTEASAPSGVEEQAQEAAARSVEPHDHGIPEPPQGSPSSVRDMVYAIRAMWDAEEALSTADTAKALTYEREALKRLKRAQLAARYIPPIIAQSKPIDLKRRYAGELAEIRTRLEKLGRRGGTKQSLLVRAALADAYAALTDLQGTIDVPAAARVSATERAKERARRAADALATVGGDHAASVAEAIGQLRIVETELGRIETGGRTEEYAERIGKPLALLTQAASNLFAIADQATRGAGGDATLTLPTDDARAAEYFRRLAGRAP